MKIETGLVVRRETKFDRIRESIYNLFFGKDYQMIQRMEELITPKRIRQGMDTKNIIIPIEIGKRKKKL